jgi:hypothetical protein
MKHPTTIHSRRDVLRLASASALVTLVPALSSCDLIRPDLETVAEAMIDTLNHPERAREIGKMYTRQYPGVGERSYQQLTRELLAALELELGDLSYLSLDSLSERLGEQVRRDFAVENVVIVDRWMFSRTEALLCALARAYG